MVLLHKIHEHPYAHQRYEEPKPKINIVTPALTLDRLAQAADHLLRISRYVANAVVLFLDRRHNGAEYIRRGCAAIAWRLPGARPIFSEPRRCPSCRAARKASRGDYGSSGMGGGSRGGYSSGPREMFSATCSNCGREALVPFRPSGAKPVYCSDCFTARRG